MQVKVLLGAALVLAGGLGFVAGRVTSKQSGQEEVLRELHRQRELLVEHLSRQQAGPPPTRCATASDAVDAAGLRAEVARSIREELHAAGLERPAPREEAAPPPPSPRSVAAHQEGLRLLDEATRARRWREEDAVAMRRLLADMTPRSVRRSSAGSTPPSTRGASTCNWWDRPSEASPLTHRHLPHRPLARPTRGPPGWAGGGGTTVTLREVQD